MGNKKEQKTVRTENGYEQITPEIIEDMQMVVEGNFPGDFSYALTSGSIVFGGAIKGKSDMDLMVVLKKEFADKPKMKRDVQITGFVDGYLNLHKDNGFIPDLVFPGEYITEDQAEDAIAGRGYHVNGYSQLYLPQASEEYYLEDPERWYRAWLSMTAYGEYVAGNKDTFEKNKTRAWNTLILFNSRDLTSPITPDGIIDRLSAPANKWAGSGISERYFTFREHELQYVGRALGELSDKGYFSLRNGLFLPVSAQINQWHIEKAAQIQDKSIRKASFIVDSNEAKQFTAYAESRWSNIQKK